MILVWNRILVIPSITGFLLQAFHLLWKLLYSLLLINDLINQQCLFLSQNFITKLKLFNFFRHLLIFFLNLQSLLHRKLHLSKNIEMLLFGHFSLFLQLFCHHLNDLVYLPWHELIIPLILLLKVGMGLAIWLLKIRQNFIIDMLDLGSEIILVVCWWYCFVFL